MPLDADAIQRGCRGADVTTARHLCRAETRALSQGSRRRRRRSSLAARRKRRCFAEVADENAQQRLTFVNIRETAGWSTEAAKAGPKMAALIAAAAEPVAGLSRWSVSRAKASLSSTAATSARSKPRICSTEHLDVTVLISAARRFGAAARHRIFRSSRARSAPPRAISARSS